MVSGCVLGQQYILSKVVGQWKSEDSFSFTLPRTRSTFSIPPSSPSERSSFSSHFPDPRGGNGSLEEAVVVVMMMWEVEAVGETVVAMVVEDFTNALVLPRLILRFSFFILISHSSRISASTATWSSTDSS